MVLQSEKVCVQAGVPFSESKIWAAQRHYYHTQGIEAWAEQVPFYVTSNPVIADHYAKMIVLFFQDYLLKNPSSEKQTFYLVELGAGTGQFSYYVVKRILDLLSLWGLEHVSFCYVITDFTQTNIDHWRHHNCLEPLIERGVLDFATFDLENDTYLRLQCSNVCLSENTVSTPLTGIANYLFDSVVMDVFRVQNKKIQESLVNISVDPKHVNTGDVDWSKVDFDYSNQDISEHYYQHAVLDQVLAQYAEHLQDTYVQFPIGSLRGLESLSAISNGQMFLLSSDKGYVSLNELDDLEQPSLAFHGSFSTMVNFHAIAEFFRLQNGDAFLQEEYDAFATGAFSLGFDFASMPTLNAMLKQTIGGFSPGHFFHLYEHFDKTVKSASLETIVSMLNFTFWDPAIFDLASDRISDLLDDADDDVVQYLLRKLPLIADQFYFVPGANDVLFDVAVVYQEMGQYDQAIIYFKQSLKYYPATYEFHFNMGYCHLELKQYDVALEEFRKAEAFQPKSKELKSYIKQVEKACDPEVRC